MTLMSEAVEQKHLRAPRENGGTLIEPPLAAIGEIVEQNVAAAAQYDYDLQGISLKRLAAQARAELFDAAYRYTRTYRDVEHPGDLTGARAFVAGHQPQLVHPGVWFKNFVLSAIARQHGAVAINLAIDSDTIKTASLRVPTGSAEQPKIESVPVDRQTAEIPYEERAVVDLDCLRSFGRRAEETIRPLVPNPLVRQFWPLVIERARASAKLGECLAQARHQQEGQWGATTWEIPQSVVCQLPAFYWFTSHLLANLPRLWEQYNRSVSDYRRANRVRSSAHPVPDLASEDDWLEAPFWIWDRDNPRRRRLFVRQRGDEIILSDRQALEVPLALSPEGEAQRAVEQLAELSARGIRLRTRALITTLFARLFLSDLFLHGLGGAKYDQVTDVMAERFFGVKAPTYMTITGTLRLPIARAAIGLDDARRVDAQLRELDFHAERFVEPPLTPEVQAIMADKRRWIETAQTRQNAKTRCRMIRAANQSLQPSVAEQRGRLIQTREQLAARLRAETILASREYAFCLHPAESLERLMQVASE